MAEYIERDALLGKLIERDLCLCVSESDIKGIPAADVAPVKHGRWIKDIPMGFKCSLCGCLMVGETNFCPKCGSLMRKEAINGS